MLAGCRRTATARAIEPSVVRAVDRASYERWVDEDDARSEALAEVARARIDGHRLLALIRDVLGVDERSPPRSRRPAMGAAGPRRGAVRRGRPPDAAFLFVSGRLTVVQGGDHVREVARGELVGEIGLIERAPRSASIIALRDSTLARFDVDAFRTLTDAHPALMLQVARTILGRLGRPNESRDRARSVAVAVTAPIDGRRCLARLADELACHGTTRHLSADGVDATLVGPDSSSRGGPTCCPRCRSSCRTPRRGTTTCCGDGRRVDPVDEGVVRPRRPHRGRHVGAARRRRAPPRCGCARAVPDRRAVERWLVLLHRPGTSRPTGSAAVADPLGVDRVTHVRDGSVADLARIARLVSGNGTGLVLGGGGARGFAHLGAWRALRELGIEVDAIGGASIGAPMGVMMALQLDPDDARRR